MQHDCRANQPKEEGCQPDHARHAGQLPLFVRCQGLGSLLSHDHLQGAGRNQAHHQAQERDKQTVFLGPGGPGQEMDRPRQGPANHIGEHEPAALAEERGAVLGFGRMPTVTLF